MKRFTLVLVVLCLVGVTAMAQDDQDGNKRGKMSLTEMVKRMDDGMAKAISGLSDAQKEIIDSLNTDFMTAMSKNRPNMKEGERPSSEDMEAMRTAMEKSRNAYNASLKEVLSESQYAEYEKYEKSMHQHGGQRGGGQGDAPQGDAPQDGDGGPQD